MKSQVDLIGYIAVAGAFGTALEAVTDLGLVRADLIIESIADPFDVTAGANVDVGATFVGYIQDGNGKKASHKLPGVKDAFRDGTGGIPITGAIQTYLNQFLTAGDWRLSDGQTIASWIKGKLDK